MLGENKKWRLYKILSTMKTGQVRPGSLYRASPNVPFSFSPSFFRASTSILFFSSTTSKVGFPLNRIAAATLLSTWRTFTSSNSGFGNLQSSRYWLQTTHVRRRKKTMKSKVNIKQRPVTNSSFSKDKCVALSHHANSKSVCVSFFQHPFQWALYLCRVEGESQMGCQYSLR